MKFRVFDKRSNEYRYVELEEADYRLGFFIEHDGTATMADFGPWQMSTGLPDFKGSEIFQGDRLDHCYTLYPVDTKNPYEVVFEDGCFRKQYKDWPEGLDLPILTRTELSILSDTIIGDNRP